MSKRKVAFKKAIVSYEAYCKKEGIRILATKYHIAVFEVKVRNRPQCEIVPNDHFNYTRVALKNINNDLKSEEGYE